MCCSHAWDGDAVAPVRVRMAWPAGIAPTRRVLRTVYRRQDEGAAEGECDGLWAMGLASVMAWLLEEMSGLCH
jgi:hypothetical protein